jgi:hypothetical protein
VLISESHSCLYISGVRLENHSLRSVNAAFDEWLGPDEIDHILSKAYLRRAEGAELLGSE